MNPTQLFLQAAMIVPQQQQQQQQPHGQASQNAAATTRFVRTAHDVDGNSSVGISILHSVAGKQAVTAHRTEQQQKRQQQFQQQQQQQHERRRNVIPEVSTGLLEATTQLRNTVPAARNFRLGAKTFASPQSHRGDFFVALKQYLVNHAQEQQRKRFKAGSVGSNAAKAAATTNSVPTSLNFVGAGISFVPANPVFFAALSSELNSELNMFAANAAADIAGERFGDETDATDMLPHITSYFTAHNGTKSNNKHGVRISCRGDRARRIFTETSAFTNDDVLLSKLRAVDTLYLSNNPALGARVEILLPHSHSTITPVANAAAALLLLVPSAISSPLNGLLHFPNLKKLSLASCGIYHVSQLTPLRLLPSLEHLFLEGNPICFGDVSAAAAASSTSASSSSSSSAASGNQYRSLVISWFSHCACCCCSCFSCGGGGAVTSASCCSLSFRANRLVSLDGRNISDAERQRAISDTNTSFLPKMKKLRLLFQQSVLLTVVATRLALNEEFKHGGPATSLVMKKRFASSARAASSLMMMRSASSSSSSSDLRSRQKRAVRLLLLLSILSSRGAAALASPLFVDTTASPSASSAACSPCQLCGNATADVLLINRVTKTLRRMCLGVAKRPRSEQVAARMPMWNDAVRETEQQLRDVVEENIVVLVNSLQVGARSVNSNNDAAAMSPLVDAVVGACRSWPETTTSTTTSTKSNATAAVESTSWRVVCGFPPPNLNNSDALALEKLLLTGIDVSLFARDAKLADLSAMLTLPSFLLHNTNTSSSRHSSVMMLSSIVAAPPQQSRFDSNNNNDDDEAESAMVDLTGLLRVGEGNHHDEDQDHQRDLSDEIELLIRRSPEVRRQEQERPVAQLTEESEADELELLVARDDQQQQTQNQHEEDDDDDDDDEHFQIAVADDFYETGLARRCFVRWIQCFLHRYNSQQQQLANWSELRDFERKRAVFHSWRLATRAQQFYSRHHRELLILRVFCEWRAKAAIRREVRAQEQEGEQRRQHRQEEQRQCAANNAAADVFRRISLLHSAMRIWSSKAAVKSHVRELESLFEQHTRASARLRLLLSSACYSSKKNGSGAAMSAAQRLHADDTVRSLVIRTWREKLQKRRERKEQRTLQREEELLQQEQQEQEHEQEAQLSAAASTIEESSRRIMRRARRQLWRVFVRALKAQRVRAEVMESQQQQQQEQYLSSNSAAAVAVHGILDLTEDDIALASQALDESLAAEDDSEFLPLEPAVGRRRVASAAVSCDVSDIERRNGSDDDAMSDVGVQTLAPMLSDNKSKRTTTASGKQHQAPKPRLNLRNLRVVQSFHKLAESMAKTTG